MRAIKSTLVFMLIISLAFSMSLCVFAAKGDEVTAAKKIVSVVYDDSGSMYAESAVKWNSANYSLQTLAALLNSDDEMYVTYMSDCPNTSDTQSYVNKTKKIDLNNIERTISEIKNKGDAKATPIGSVVTALDKLKSVKSSDESTQYWLVIMSDGIFQRNGLDDKAAIKNKIDEIKGQKMSNGSTINVDYISIGAKAVKLKADETNGFYCDEAKEDQITDVMRTVAGRVSSRITVKNSDLTPSSGKTKSVVFNSKLPMFSIAVLSQKSNAKIKSAKNETPLSVDRNIKLDAVSAVSAIPIEKISPIIRKQTTPNLFGNLATISNKDDVIPAGQCHIEFSEEVDVSELVILYEPAIDLSIIIKKDGDTVKDPSALNFGQEVSVELIPVIPGTDTVIDDSDMPNGVKWHISYEADGKPIKDADSRTLDGIQIEANQTNIIGTLQIPNFAPLTKIIPFDTLPANYGIKTDQPDQVSFARSSIEDGNTNGNDIVFTITNNDVPLTKEEAEDMKLEIDSISVDDSEVTGFFDSFGFIECSVAFELTDDGKFVAKPKPGFITMIAPFLVKAGKYDFTVKLSADESVKASGTFSMVANSEDWLYVFPSLAFLVFTLYIFYIVLIKHKFHNERLEITEYDLSADGKRGIIRDTTIIKLPMLCPSLFNPFSRNSKKRLYGIPFVASSGKMIVIPGKFIKAEYASYGSSDLNPKLNLRGVFRGLSVISDDALAIADAYISSTPMYFRRDRNGRRVFSVKII